METTEARRPVDPNTGRIPWCLYLLLRKPGNIRTNLAALADADRIDRVPTLWQMFMGVLYMWHRIFFRPDTIGMSASEPERDTVWARRFRNRAIRFPFLLGARAVYPLDFTGLGCSVFELHHHLLGAYHPGENALYDLEILSVHPGTLDALRADVVAVLEDRHPRAAHLRDLVVYEGYHERLLTLVDRAIAGDFGPPPESDANPDTTLRAFIQWCAHQPACPREFVRALVGRRLDFSPRVESTGRTTA